MNDNEFELVKRVAKELRKKLYLGNLYEDGDLYTAGWQAVNEAHDKFGDTVAEDLLSQVIRRRMIDHVRTLRKRSTDPEVAAIQLGVISLTSDEDYEDNTQFEAALNREEFEDIISVLSTRERSMIRMNIEHELNYREIAEIFGLTESRVCQIFNYDILPSIKQAIA